MNFGPESAAVTCPNCQASITTRAEKESTSSTHLAAVLLCIFCCPLVCCPYLMKVRLAKLI